MNPVSQTRSDDAAGARQRAQAMYFARAALATAVTLTSACLATGCAAQELRTGLSAASLTPQSTDLATLQRWPDPTDAMQGWAAEPVDVASSPFAGLAGQWLTPAGLGSQRASQPSADVGGDVWSKLRHGFQLDDRHHRRVEKAAASYHSKPESWARIEQRARRFLPIIVKEVEQRRLPLELALIPVVESTFDPTAVSPAQAAGLWQIIPTTAKTLGLERNGHYDGRRDVVAATGAALDYLQTLAAEFDGDWELALASYNAGSATVKRAMARNRENGRPTDYWSLDLPSETEAYVPRLLAVARVVRQPGTFGLQLSDLPAEPEVTPIRVAEQIDLSLAAKLANMSLSELKDLNPGLTSTRSPLASQQTLLVPTEKAPTLLAELDRRALRQPLASAADATLWNSAGADAEPAQPERGAAVAGPAPDTTHVVGKGDSLWAVARKHSVEVAQIAKVNRIKPDSVLREGQRLTIPTGAPRTSQLAGHAFDGEG